MAEGVVHFFSLSKSLVGVEHFFFSRLEVAGRISPAPPLVSSFVSHHHTHPSSRRGPQTPKHTLPRRYHRRPPVTIPTTPSPPPPSLNPPHPAPAAHPTPYIPPRIAIHSASDIPRPRIATSPSTQRAGRPRPPMAASSTSERGAGQTRSSSRRAAERDRSAMTQCWRRPPRKPKAAAAPQMVRIRPAPERGIVAWWWWWWSCEILLFMC